MIKICEICNDEFQTKKSHFEIRRTCSLLCMKSLPRTLTSGNCLICSTEFKYYKRIRNPIKKYCSTACKVKSQIKTKSLISCNRCSKQFITPGRYKNKYCSIDCYSLSQKGVKRGSIWDGFSHQDKIDHLKKLFENHVIRNDIGCWGWKGGKSRGYGHIFFDNKNIKAHRASWMIHNGEILNKLLVCHKCDNRICTNPEHLFLGTQKDNVQDMIKKNRQHKQKK